MNEIEKLYENAQIKPFPTCNNCNMLDDYWSNGTYYSTCRCDKSSYECDIANYIYPPFTAEKQLELIKWLAFRDYITIVAYMSGEYHSEHDKYNADENSLEGCLARLINNLWQDLTEEEKEQIKDILK